MAFWDVMHSIGRMVGLYSDADAGYQEREYSDYEQQEDVYEPVEEAEPSYTSGGYGSGDSYVRAGAKLRPPAPRRAEEPSLIDNLLGRNRQQRPEPAPQPAYRPDNVLRMPDRDARGHAAEPEPEQMSLKSSTIIFCVRRKDDSSQIIEYLLTGINVILNFEEVDDALCQRVLDMISGAAFALRGTVARISHRNYLIAPTGVEIVRGEAQAQAPREGRDGRDILYAVR